MAAMKFAIPVIAPLFLLELQFLKHCSMRVVHCCSVVFDREKKMLGEGLKILMLKG